MTGDTDAYQEALNGLTIYLASVIRDNENPDHSGPEDAAAKLAGQLLEAITVNLQARDWRKLLDDGQ